MIVNRNLFFRIFIVLLFLLPILFIQQFYIHFYAYLSSNVITEVVTKQWLVVLFFIILFMAFLIPLSYRRKAGWLEYGLVAAFFVSLFVEMYGIPLTILLASKYFFVPGTQLPPNILSISFMGVGLGLDMAMVYGSILILIGMILIILGWVTLYRNSKKEGLVTSGIYKYSRHPQYLGFIFIILGWFFGWPTPLTIIFAPILIYKYLDVCHKEEIEVSKKHPEYKDYRLKVPFMI
ncbi:MAG: isoprenylcysteine carboxylmethyltransferase family protein [Methanobacteriaceae archaeon]|nr:isoprenylcysteine carboxylmethyltransferase family protein [Methanobacteriaceae archaeon]MDP3034399.1 isoprenylcysteine carboxylmethyltransferase family protein [Methanobacteriaceae archaeon]MDP3484134.1 isoprenylcysteine carboxylmethyltransferase family protein [Methanobacteriaceae archaeon]